MTLYSLPDGTEVEGLGPERVHLGTPQWVDHPTLGPILIDRPKLTPVKPSVSEPLFDGAHVTVDPPGARTYAFTRMEAVRKATMPQYPAEDCWWWHDDQSWVRWKDICSHGTPKVWTPDPAASAPALPWFCLDQDGDRFRVLVSPETGAIEVSVTQETTGQMRIVNPDPDQAEMAGWALLAAAREARSVRNAKEVDHDA